MSAECYLCVHNSNNTGQFSTQLSREVGCTADPVCVCVSLPEQGSRAAQGEAGRCLCGEARGQPEHGGRPAAEDAMPQVRGVSADRVRRVPLLQGHEEVRGARQDEAVLHHEAVHRRKCCLGLQFVCRALCSRCVSWVNGCGTGSSALSSL